MSNTTITEQRLYGLPGADRLHFDPADVVQEWLDDSCDDDRAPIFVIEEWSVRPARDHLPKAADIIEWIEEWSSENGEFSDDPDISFGGDDATAAADALLDLLATQITFLMADKHLRELHVTPSGDPDNPLLDGEPTWRRSPCDCPECHGKECGCPSCVRALTDGWRCTKPDPGDTGDRTT